jgi:hypothetical protein
MTEKKTCQLCLSCENNELRYGKLFEREGLVVHQFCMVRKRIFLFLQNVGKKTVVALHLIEEN